MALVGAMQCTRMTSDSLSGDLPWLEWRWKCSGMRCEGQPES